MNREILPNENMLWAETHAGTHLTDGDREQSRKLRAHVQDKVREAGLWAPHLPAEYGGAGLDFLELAYMYEVLAYAVGASALFGVVAPNSGNQSILVKYGTEEQKQRWLLPLIDGTMQSGFSMTEPDQPGSDPRSLKTTARRDGDEWVINGHKWFTSNGRRADFFIVMCRTEDVEGGAGGNAAMTQIIVPTDTPGVNIVRGINVWGRRRPSDHCEIIYDDVRVPLANALGARGSGHQAAQDRLGAGRGVPLHELGRGDVAGVRPDGRAVHHPRGARRAAGDQAVHPGLHRGLLHRHAGGPSHDHPLCREDGRGPRDARTDISAIKVFVPAAFHRVVDRAIQVWGAAGVSGDLPLAGMYQGARALRLADGPDEVHQILIAKNVLNRLLPPPPLRGSRRGAGLGLRQLRVVR